MKEQNTKIVEKEIYFEKNEQKIKMSIMVINIEDSSKIKDFLEIMFKEIKELLF